ncbi:hypothetical protein A8O14_02630 [Polynucleobacter wuianus]|uniref:Uncharacterized protein n=1 Tax=Polynucleobacter wuianus TaxID=1743168 RepID=A0A191UDJ3_9BURK|nr:MULTISPECIES: hypothetical protein [Polynucleobacter]ANI99084.1 hypothetical protein A8O14_02630 [Polynucleobacter wuianus]MBU3552345.1 hypothetical protein [Polynucleobacter sp. MWH-Post4-6-1]
MSNQRNFLYLDEVAKRLESDERRVIDLILDGSLTLSAELAGAIPYERGTTLSNDVPENFGSQHEFIDGRFIEFDETLRMVSNCNPDFVLESGNLVQVLKVMRSQLSTNKVSSVETSLVNTILIDSEGTYIRMVELISGEWHPSFHVPNDVSLVIKKENLDAFMAKVQGSKVIDRGEALKPMDSKKYIPKGHSKFRDAITPVIIDAYNECLIRADVVGNADVHSMLASWAGNIEKKSQYPTLIGEAEGEIKWQGSSNTEFLNIKKLGDRLRRLKQ